MERTGFLTFDGARLTDVKNLLTAFMVLAFQLLSACNLSPDQPVPNDHASIQGSVIPTEGSRTDQPIIALTTAPATSSIEDALLSVVESTFHFDRLGALHVIGVVRNHSDQALANIQVSIQIRDSQGQTITQATVPLSTDPLFPGERAVFIWEFQEISITTPLVTADIVSFNLAAAGRVDFEIRNINIARTGDARLHLTGEILNSLLVPVYVDQLSAAFFDQDGHIRAANTWELGSHYLEPGEIGPFRITIDLTNNAQSQPSDVVELYYRAEKGPLIQPVGLSFQGEPEYYIASDGTFHLVARLINDSGEVLQPYLLASIYDPQGNLIDTSLSTLFGLPLSPSETLPVDFSGWGALNDGLPDPKRIWKYALQWDPYRTQSTSSKWISLEPQLDSQRNDAGIVRVQGTISNPGEHPVNGYTIVARFWDPADGRTLALIAQTGEGTLSAGQSTPFILEVNLSLQAGDLSPEIELIAKGQPLE